ncbi:MAG TPA: hypothetical protein VFT53_04285 [Candidatus Saccharimonadales bacterium]|nr:hypothetical protein [Candidatus Saccharimonadales bacterium]
MTSEHTPQSERQEVNALEIRAHRLIDPNLLRALHPAEATLEVDATIQDVENSPSLPGATPYDAWYARDVLGNDPTVDKPAVRAGWLKFVGQFISLDDGTEVHLTATKDGACRACIFGQHCDTDQDDIGAMYRFLGLAQNVAQHEGRRSSGDYHLIVSNGGLERIITTKRIVAKVIAYQKAQRPLNLPSPNVGRTSSEDSSV